MPTILILTGSLRDGFNAALARLASREFTPFADVRIYAELASLPHYREELDEHGVDSDVDAFRAAIAAADAVLLVTPEYNAGPSSLIKNALDTASRPRGRAPLAGKPVAVIGATPSPGEARSARAALMRGLAVAGAQPIEPSTGVGSAYRFLEGGEYSDEVAQIVRPTLDALLVAIGVIESAV